MCYPVQYVLDVAANDCPQDQSPVDCRRRYENRRQRVSSHSRPWRSTYPVLAPDTLWDISEVP